MCGHAEITWFNDSPLDKIMDEQRLKEKIRACELKISDMQQEVLILRMKIEREKQILKRYRESLKNENYVTMKRSFQNV
jgi:hypothetical protein